MKIHNKIKPKINESLDPIIREKKYNTYLDEIYKVRELKTVYNSLVYDKKGHCC